MAHLVRGSMLDYVEFDRDLVVAKTIVPDSIAGQRLDDADVRNRFGVTIVKIKTATGRWEPASANTVPQTGDTIIVIGSSDRTERFCTHP
ncbi:cation:proton antiporter regulatory subunit [Curtobacterium sp. SP.BCp]|uniref:cation:proton antiporter regulatory subunit n=1 Tax=Curtobacterium sp. SP.BCp TaxID=3435230 RepID=UPI003F73B9EC